MADMIYRDDLNDVSHFPMKKHESCHDMVRIGTKIDLFKTGCRWMVSAIFQLFHSLTRIIPGVMTL